MTSEERGSVTHWIAALKAGDQGAAQLLWERYFHLLVQLARTRLRARSRAESDEEDVALSAFNSLCTGAARGHFPKLNDRDDLWRLLVVITARKALAQVRREGRKKRGSGQILTEADIAADDPDDDAAGLEWIIGREPTPEFAAMVAEQCQRLLGSLGDESLRQVALWRMEGYTNDEIAERLGCARRTVARRFELIRKIWLGEGS